MIIFLAQPDDELRARFFTPSMIEQLGLESTLRLNALGTTLSDDALADGIGDADIAIIISWAYGQVFTDAVLAKCPRLKLIANPCGSVATTITDAVYARGIKVCSSNNVMAQYVAEATLAYILAGLRDIPNRFLTVRCGGWSRESIDTLFGASVGLVGLGTIGRFLLDLLAPFNVSVSVYDPYVPLNALDKWRFARLSTLEDVLQSSDIVSVHASRTPETYRLLNRERLAMLRDGALLVNTARGALIDEDALAEELAGRRIRVVLDVFDNEPLNEGSPLLNMPNAILQPHMAAGVKPVLFAKAMVAEILRFIHGEPLQLEIPYEQYKRMTR